MDEPIVWIIIGFLAIIISREIVCWYWKINDILEEQKQQTKILEEILYTMNPNATYFEENNEENEEENEQSTPE